MNFKSPLNEWIEASVTVESTGKAQLCPKCKGKGRVYAKSDHKDRNAGYEIQVCLACEGKGNTDTVASPSDDAVSGLPADSSLEKPA